MKRRATYCPGDRRHCLRVAAAVLLPPHCCRAARRHRSAAAALLPPPFCCAATAAMPLMATEKPKLLPCRHCADTTSAFVLLLLSSPLPPRYHAASARYRHCTIGTAMLLRCLLLSPNCHTACRHHAATTVAALPPQLPTAAVVAPLPPLLCCYHHCRAAATFAAVLPTLPAPQH